MLKKEKLVNWWRFTIKKFDRYMVVITKTVHKPNKRMMRFVEACIAMGQAYSSLLSNEKRTKTPTFFVICI
jgi:hypothetical protein